MIYKAFWNSIHVIDVYLIFYYSQAMFVWNWSSFLFSQTNDCHFWQSTSGVSRMSQSVSSGVSQTSGYWQGCKWPTASVVLCSMHKANETNGKNSDNKLDAYH